MEISKILKILSFSGLIFGFGYFYGYKHFSQQPQKEISRVYLESEDALTRLYQEAWKKKYQSLKDPSSVINKNTNPIIDAFDVSRLDERNLQLLLSKVPSPILEKVLNERKNFFYVRYIQPREPKVPSSLPDLEEQISDSYSQFEGLLGEGGRKEFYASTVLKSGNFETPIHLRLSLWQGMPINVSHAGVSQFEISNNEGMKTYPNLCFNLKYNFPNLDYQSSRSKTQCLQELGKRDKTYVQFFEIKSEQVNSHIAYLDLELPTSDFKSSHLSYFDRSQNAWVNHGDIIQWKEETTLQSLNFESENQ